MLLRRTHPALVLVATVITAACGAGVAGPSTNVPGNGTASPPSGAQSTLDVGPSASGGDTWPWDAAPTEDHSHVDNDGVSESGAPNGDLLGEVATDPDLRQPVPANDAQVAGVDPCTLITFAEWSGWTERALGSASVLPEVVLEDGDACGWIGPGDRVRMAIAAFRAGGSTGWLDETDAAAGREVAGLGDRALWLMRWPVPASSTLVVRVRSYDLVIEMSSLEPRDDVLLAGARELAAIAIGRVP